MEERIFEVSLEIQAGSGCAEMAGMTGEGKNATEGKLTVLETKSGQGDTERQKHVSTRFSPSPSQRGYRRLFRGFGCHLTAGICGRRF